MYNPKALGALGLFIAVARVVGMGSFFAANAILARRLGRDEFGQFLFGISLVMVVSAIVRMGLNRVILRSAVERVSAEDADGYAIVHQSVYHTLARNSLVLALLVAISFLLAWPPTIDWRFGFPVVIASVLMAVAQVRAENLRGLGAVQEATLLDCQRAAPLVNLLFLAEVLILAAMGNVEFDYVLALWLYVIAGAAVLLLSWRRLRIHVSAVFTSGGHHKPSRDELRSVAGQALPIALSDLVAIAAVNFDLWIAKVTLSSGELADLGVAMQLCALVVMPLSLAGTTISHVIPKLYFRRETARLEELLRRACAAAVTLALPPIVAICLFPKSVLSFVYGTGFAESYPILLTLCVAKCIFLFVGTTGLVLVLTGNQRHGLIVNAVALLLQMGLGYVAATVFGLWGLVVTTSAVSICHSIALLLVTHRVTGMWTHCSFDFWSQRSPSMLANPLGVGKKRAP